MPRIACIVAVWDMETANREIGVPGGEIEKCRERFRKRKGKREKLVLRLCAFILSVIQKATFDGTGYFPIFPIMTIATDLTVAME